MGRRRIEGTKHIRRKPKKGAIIAGISAIAIAAIATLGAFIYQGKISMSKLRGDKSIISKSISVENEENLFILGGTGSAGSMVTIGTGDSEHGSASGTSGMLQVSNKQKEPGEENTYFFEYGATADRGYLFDYWEIYNEDSSLLGIASANPIRIYYYNDDTKVGRYEGDSFSAFITNSGATVKPVFKRDPNVMLGPANDDDVTITVITTPNVGQLRVQMTPGNLIKSMQGYLSTSFSQDTTYSVSIRISDGEKHLFLDENNPRAKFYRFRQDGTLVYSSAGDEYPLDSIVSEQLNPGEYYIVINPHLKTGFENQAVPVAVPDHGGVATWTGNQLKATANPGFKFDHWEWVENNRSMSSKDNPMFANPLGVIVYKAMFVRATYNVSVGRITPANSAAVTGTGSVDEGKDTTITVTPQPGYKFKDVTWTTENGIVNQPTDLIVDDNGVATFTVPNVREDIYLNVEMENTKFTIDVKKSPEGYGNVSVENKTNSKGTKYDKEEFAAGDAAELVATANSDNTFLYWEDSKGNRYTDSTLKIDKVYASESFTAYFAPSKIKVEIEPGDGSIKVDYVGEDGKNKSAIIASTSPDKYVYIRANTNITLTATPPSGKYFACYTSNKPNDNKYKENPLTVPNIVENVKYTANYADNTCKIKVNVSPAGVAKVNIEERTQDSQVKQTGQDVLENVTRGNKIVLTAADAIGYNFLYFKDQYGNKFSNGYSFDALSGDETFTAYYVPTSVKVKVGVGSSSNASRYDMGTITISYTDNSGTYNTDTIDSVDAETDASRNPKTIKGGSSITLTANPKPGYYLKQFIDIDNDGKAYQPASGSNSYTFTNITSDTQYRAEFDSRKCKVTVDKSPAADTNTGIVTIKKSDGTLILSGDDVPYGDTVTITATNNGDYEFLYFKDSFGNLYYDKEISFTARNANESYTAYFVKKAKHLKISLNPGIDAGTVETTYWSATEGKEITVRDTLEFSDVGNERGVSIKAIPKTGYKFYAFIRKGDGTLIEENPLIIFGGHDMSDDNIVNVYFIPEEVKITALAVPETGGTVTVNGNSSSETVKYGETVTLLATPTAPNYAFRYFEDSSGNKFSGNDEGNGKYSLTFEAKNGTETYKAVFGLANVNLKVKVDPSTTDSQSGAYVAGGYSVAYTSTDGSYIQTPDTYIPREFDNVKGMTNVKITAIPKAGYKFSKFIDTDGNTYTENPLVYANLPENKDVEIIFVPDAITITGTASPEMGGSVTVNGKVGSQQVQFGEGVELKATPNDGYTFKMFKDSQGNEFVSNPLNFKAVNGSETYTAYFVKEEVTVTIDLTPSGSGTVRFNDEPAVSKRTTYTTDGRSNVRLTAMAKEGKEFVYWKDQDGNQYPDNPLTIVDISKDLVFTAVFDGEVTGIRAVASPASGGKIKKIVNDNGSITLIATANKGYTFVNWKKGDKLLTLGTKYVVKAADVHDGDVYTAYFKYNPNYDAKSDITKEKFYREWRKVVTPNYTVTRDSMKLLAMQTVSGLRQYDDAAPDLRSYNAVANAQAYFDEKVAKDIQRLDGIFGDAELMTVEGEVLPPDLLPDFTVYEKIAKEFTDKKFGKHYDTEILTVKRVIQPENFDNVKRTYLWRYTGAEFKDNIYLLYEVDGKKPKWVSPIVDPDGVLKFTINKFEDRDIVAVVRVKIKD